MACNYYIKKQHKSGMVPVFVRIRSRILNVDVKLSTNLDVDAFKWNSANSSPKAFANFRKSKDGVKLFAKLDVIEQLLEEQLQSKVAVTSEQARMIIDSIVYAEARAAQQKRKEEKEKKAAEAGRMTLNKYIRTYIEQVSNGTRQTEQGRNYAHSTVKTIRQAMKQFELFQQETRHRYDFNDIDMTFYYDYTAYLKKKGYAINTMGKCVKELKAILYSAEIEGYHSNSVWKNKKFKGTRIDVDSIYLTHEDLNKLMAVDLSRFGIGHEQARDIFMVGVWTAQRVSDYNNIKKEDFDTLTKNVMHEEPDPEHPGQMRAWIEKREITYLNIRQQKTGAKVSIPCNSRLMEILKKYDWQMPHLEDLVINRYIKEVAKEAGLTEPVEIETTKGGTPKKETFEKWQLVHTHTARRTGATLMYLAGVDLYDIMKVTGHSSPAMLKKYIKADNLTVVEKLSDKYDYFK